MHLSAYVFIHLSILSGIYNQAFGDDICGNPLYEGCDLTQTSNDPVEFAPSSLVSPNPLYGDLDELPGHRSQKTGRLNEVISTEEFLQPVYTQENILQNRKCFYLQLISCAGELTRQKKSTPGISSSRRFVIMSIQDYHNFILSSFSLLR